jgi:fatty acid desaturase
MNNIILRLKTIATNEMVLWLLRVTLWACLMPLIAVIIVICLVACAIPSIKEEIPFNDGIDNNRYTRPDNGRVLVRKTATHVQ